MKLVGDGFGGWLRLRLAWKASCADHCVITPDSDTGGSVNISALGSIRLSPERVKEAAWSPGDWAAAGSEGPRAVGSVTIFQPITARRTTEVEIAYIRSGRVDPVTRTTASEQRDRTFAPRPRTFILPGILLPSIVRVRVYSYMVTKSIRWLGSRVVSVLDSGAEGPGFQSQPRRCRVTVLGKLFTPIVPLFTKQQNW